MFRIPIGQRNFPSAISLDRICELYGIHKNASIQNETFLFLLMKGEIPKDCFFKERTFSEHLQKMFPKNFFLFSFPNEKISSNFFERRRFNLLRKYWNQIPPEKNLILLQEYWSLELKENGIDERKISIPKWNFNSKRRNLSCEIPLLPENLFLENEEQISRELISYRALQNLFLELRNPYFEIPKFLLQSYEKNEKLFLVLLEEHPLRTFTQLNENFSRTDLFEYLQIEIYRNLSDIAIDKSTKEEGILLKEVFSNFSPKIFSFAIECLENSDFHLSRFLEKIKK